MNVAASEGPAMVAPNLIGCGISEGSAEWDPEQRGLFIPLDWVRGCEALMRRIQQENDTVLPDVASRPASNNTGKQPTDVLRSFWNKFVPEDKEWIVVAQGGLAPIGVLLAARNPKMVRKLVLASPPLWKEMTTPVSEKDLSRNLNFFQSMLGKLAFGILERRGTIALFSNLFLFSEPCDDKWLDLAEKEMGKAARPPVAIFNAGFTLNKSLESELLSLRQPTLVVQGEDDPRIRDEYSNMKDCTMETVQGKNVIPWEYPEQFWGVVKDFIRKECTFANILQ
jgi:pimeloyl-ACP methyl ester carboxylesterase